MKPGLRVGTRGLLTTALLFASLATTATELEDFLERYRPAENQRARIIAQAEGVLQGQVPVQVVLFTFVSDEQRDPAYGQFLVVLSTVGYEAVAPQLPSRVVRVGGAQQHFSTLTVSEGLIHLAGKVYAPRDPRCCPSLTAAARYRLDGRWLTALVTPD